MVARLAVVGAGVRGGPVPQHVEHGRLAYNDNSEGRRAPSGVREKGVGVCVCVRVCA